MSDTEKLIALLSSRLDYLETKVSTRDNLIVSSNQLLKLEAEFHRRVDADIKEIKADIANLDCGISELLDKEAT